MNFFNTELKLLKALLLNATDNELIDVKNVLIVEEFEFAETYALKKQ